MNIVYLGSFRFPNGDAAAARVLNNAKIMRTLGHEVLFVSWKSPKNHSEILSYDDFRYICSGGLDLEGNVVHRLKSYWNRYSNSLKALEILNVKPDFIIAYNADFHLTKLLLKYCKNNCIKFANDLTEWYKMEEIPMFDRILYYFNMRYLQHKVQNKIVISSYLDKYYSQSNNLLLPPLCSREDAKWNQEKYNLLTPYNGVTLIYAGTPAKKDLLHNAINTVNRIAKEGENIRFIILGITKENYLKNYSNLLYDKKLHSNIIFLGRVNQELIPSYYKLADFMVLLRISNRKNMAGFPTKVAESYTAGIPVISNDTSDLRRYIKNGQNGYILNDFDVNSFYNLLKNTIIKLSSHKIAQLKACAINTGTLFDYRYYQDCTKRFLESLK